MLQKETLRKIREQNWVKMLEEDTNPSQTKQRVRDSCAQMLAQLTTFARKIPEDELESYLPSDGVQRLVTALLKEGKLDFNEILSGRLKHEDVAIFDENIPNVRKARLASSLTDLSLSSMITQCESLYRHTPVLASTTIDQLKKSILICKEIAYEIELRKQKEVALKENRDYLFKWEEIPGRDDSRFLDYLESKFGQSYSKIDFAKDEYNKILRFKTRIGPQDIDIVIGKIEIYLEDKSAELRFDNDPTNKIYFKVIKDESGTHLFTRAKDKRLNHNFTDNSKRRNTN